MRHFLIACVSAIALLGSPLAVAAAEPSEAVTFTIFMQVKTTSAWLALSPEQRFAFLGEAIEPILARHPSVRMRFFDTEFYNAEVTDVIVWEAQRLGDYQAVVEELRETPFWGVYFDVVSILPGVENAYADAYDQPVVGRQ
ncbi:MAG: darcynin [Hyphomonas sp.]|nr:darcynin [Hyphomonas sp.]